MPYLIDGHNLIGKMPGRSLSDLDDEQALVTDLQAFCRAARKQADVFFDGAPAGSSRQSGLVKAHFVRKGKPADAAIEEFLEQLKGSARNWTVVSSDGRVQRAAHKAHARAVSSEDFLRIMLAGAGSAPGTQDAKSGDLKEWLRLFGEPPE